MLRELDYADNTYLRVYHYTVCAYVPACVDGAWNIQRPPNLLTFILLLG